MPRFTGNAYRCAAMRRAISYNVCASIAARGDHRSGAIGTRLVAVWARDAPDCCRRVTGCTGGVPITHTTGATGSHGWRRIAMGPVVCTASPVGVAPAGQRCERSAHSRDRTCDLQFRKLSLYPTELCEQWAQCRRSARRNKTVAALPEIRAVQNAGEFALDRGPHPARILVGDLAHAMDYCADRGADRGSGGLRPGRGACRRQPRSPREGRGGRGGARVGVRVRARVGAAEGAATRSSAGR